MIIVKIGDKQGGGFPIRNEDTRGDPGWLTGSSIVATPRPAAESIGVIPRG